MSVSQALPLDQATRLVLQACLRAASEPMAPVDAVDEETLRVEREKSAASTVHQLELQTRQLVADRVQQAKLGWVFRARPPLVPRPAHR